jgi:hypothetical protein
VKVGVMMARRVKNIFVHCSATDYGEVLEFDRWHRQRGWNAIGYHYVILNGRPFRDVKYIDMLDGEIQPGRHLDDDPIYEDGEVGAHVAGRNSSSIGICLVGREVFSDGQLLAARGLLAYLKDLFGLTWDDVLGHYEDKHTPKTCPNMPMSAFRDYLKGKLFMDKLQRAIADQAATGWKNLEQKDEPKWYADWVGRMGLDL